MKTDYRNEPTHVLEKAVEVCLEGGNLLFAGVLASELGRREIIREIERTSRWRFIRRYRLLEKWWAWEMDQSLLEHIALDT